MPLLALLKLLLACLATCYFVWKFGTRLVVLLAPPVASCFGVSLQLQSLSRAGITGLVVKLKRGPVQAVELDSCSIRLTNGILGCLLAWLHGKPALHLAVSGLRVSLSANRGSPKTVAPGSASSAVGSSPPSADVEGQEQHKEAVSKAQKLARKLHKLLSSLSCITSEMSQLQVALQHSGLVLQLPHVTWQHSSSTPAAAEQQLQLGHLNLQQLSVSLLQENAHGGQLLRLLSFAGLSVQLTPAKSRQEGRVALQLIAVGLGQVQLNCPAHVREQLAQKLGPGASSKTSPAEAGVDGPAAASSSASPAEDPHAGIQAGAGGTARAKKARGKPPLTRQLQQGLLWLDALADKVTFHLKGVALDAGTCLSDHCSAQQDRLGEAVVNSSGAVGSSSEANERNNAGGSSLSVGLGVSIGVCTFSLERQGSAQRSELRASADTGQPQAGLQYAVAAGVGALAVQLGLQTSSGCTGNSRSQQPQKLPTAVQFSLPGVRLKASATSNSSTQQQGTGLGHLACTLSTEIQGSHIRVSQSSISAVSACIPMLQSMLQSRKCSATEIQSEQLPAAEEQCSMATSTSTSQEGLPRDTATGSSHFLPELYSPLSGRTQPNDSTVARAPLAHTLSVQLQTKAAVVLELPSSDSALSHTFNVAPSIITYSSAQTYVGGIGGSSGGSSVPVSQGASSQSQGPTSRVPSPEKWANTTTPPPISVSKPKQGSPGPGGSPAIRLEVPDTPDSPTHSGALALTPLMLTPPAAAQPAAPMQSRFAAAAQSSGGAQPDAARPDSTGGSVSIQLATELSLMPAHTLAIPTMAPAPTALPVLGQLQQRVSVELGSISWGTGEFSARQTKQQLGREPQSCKHDGMLLFIQEIGLHAGTLNSTDTMSASTPRASKSITSGLHLDGPCRQHVGLHVRGPAVQVSDNNVAAVLQICDTLLSVKQMLTATKAEQCTAGSKQKPGKQHQRAAKYAWLEQLDVQVEQLQLRVSHTMPVVTSLSSSDTVCTERAAASEPGKTSAAVIGERNSDTVGVDGSQASTQGDIQQLPCAHVLRAGSVQLCVLPCEQTWAAGMREVLLQQELPQEVMAGKASKGTCGAAPYVEKRITRPAVQRSSTGRGMGLMDIADNASKPAAAGAGAGAKPQHSQHSVQNASDGLVLEPLHIGVVDLRGQKSSERHFLRASLDEVDVHADFDCALAALGVCSTMLQHATNAQHILKRGRNTPKSAAATHPSYKEPATASQKGAEQTGTATGTSNAAVQVPIALELRVADLHASAHVGAQDVIQLTCGLLRGSSSLQELVLDELQLLMNDREVIGAQYASLKLPEPMPGDQPSCVKPPSSPRASMTFNPTPFTTPTKGKPVKPHFDSPPGSGGVQTRGGYGLVGGEGGGAGAHSVHSVHSTDRSRLRPMHGRTRSQDSEDKSPEDLQGTGHADAVSGWQRMMRQGHSLLGSLWQYEPATTLGSSSQMMLVCNSTDASSATAGSGKTAGLILLAAGDAAISSALPSASRRANVLGGQGPAGAKTTELRRTAARERLGIASPHAQTLPSSIDEPTAGVARSVKVPGKSEGGSSKSERRERKMLGVDMVLEGACLSFPHDEAPMRVYVLCELCVGAVKQVLKPCLSQLKSHLAALKPPKVVQHTSEPEPPAGQPRQSWPLFDKYIELLIEARKVDVVLEQHPLESWLALHLSALQNTASERQLWERLANSLPTPRPSANEVPPTPSAHSAVGPFGTAAAAAPLQRSGSSGQQADFINRQAGDKRLPVYLQPSDSISSIDPHPNGRSLDSMLEEEIQAMANRHRAPGGFSEDDGGASSDPSSLSSLSSDEESSQEAAWKLPDGGPGTAAGSRAGQGAASGAAHDPAAGPAAQGQGMAGSAGGYWDHVVRKVSSMYVSACKELQACSGPGKGALMHVSASRGSAVLMVCKPGVTARAHATQEIARLDAPSQGLLFEKIVPLSLDASLQEVTIKAGAAKAPLLTAASLSASGLLIRARQLTATPRTQPLMLPVGRFHAATIQRPVKGCRAPMKAYTDLRVEVEELEAAGGLGLEPVMAQVAKAFKSRIIPPDFLNSDGTAVPQSSPGSGPPLPPWDKMRYMWRGCLRFTGRHVKARMGVGLAAVPGPFEPCLQLTATTLGLNISTGRLDANLTSLSLLAKGVPPEGRPGDPLLLLPLAHLPLLTTCLHTSWVVAAGRDATQHHVFPLRHLPPEPGEVQDPVDITRLARSSGLVLGMDFNLAADYSTLGQRHAGSTNVSSAGAPTTASRPRVVSGPGGNPSQSGTSSLLLSRHFAAGSNLAPSPTPRVYVGELQVSFIRDWIQGLMSAPPMMRGSLKKRCFYEPRAPSGASPSPSHTARATANPQQAGTQSTAHALSPARSAVLSHSSRFSTKGISDPIPNTSSLQGSALPALSEASVPLTIPALITRLDINAAMDVVDVHHDAQDLADVSDFVYLRGKCVRLASNVAFTRSLTWQQRGSRQVPRWVRQATSSSLSCEASELSLVQPERGGPPVPELTGLVVAQRRLTGSSSTGRRTQEDTAEAQAGPAAPVPGFGEGLVLSARQLQLRLAPPPRGPLTTGISMGGQLGAAKPAGAGVPPKRPLRMIIQDVQIFGSAAQRDMLVATVMHLVAAFTRRAHPPITQPQQGAAAQQAASTASTTTDTAAAAASMDSAASDAGWGANTDGCSLAKTSANFRAGISSGNNRTDTASAAGRAVSVQALSAAPSLEAAAASEAALVAALVQSRNARLQEELSAANAAAAAAAAEQDEQSTADASLPTCEQDASHHSHHDGQVGVEDLPDTPRAAQPREPHSPLRSGGSMTSSASRAAQAGAEGVAANSSSRATAEADAGFQLAFELEFVRIQVAVLPVNSPSALLFATNAAVLTSTRQSSTGASRLVASMSQLQAYAVRHLGDGSTGSITAGSGKVRVPWLLNQDGGLQVPPSSSLCTVMSPFSLQITHSREGTTATATDGGGPTGSPSQDLLVQLPEVEGVLEPWQFEALLDVIQNVLICPVPQVSMMLPSSAPRPAVDSASSVVAAREVVTALGRTLCCLHQEVHVLAPGTMHAAWAQPVGGSNADGLGFAPSPDQLQAALMMPPAAGAGGGLSGGGSAAAARGRSHSREVLLSWCLDQVAGAADALDAARAVLQREESAAVLLNARALPHGGRRAGSSGGAGGRQGAPLSTCVVVGRCSWALSKAGGSVFLSAHLHGLEYTSALDKNYTGTTRLAMRGLSVQEVLPATSTGSSSTTGSPGASGFLSLPRHVIKLWQPRADPSHSVHSATSTTYGAAQPSDLATATDLPGWEYDYAFSMAAVHGGLEAPNFIVYDHIEVVLHPLELHITYGLAMALQEYFALEESAPTPAAAAPHPPTGMGPLAAGSVAFAGVMPAPASLTALGAPAPTSGSGYLAQSDMHALTRVEESERSGSSAATTTTAPIPAPDASPNRSWFPRRAGHSSTAPNSAHTSGAGAPGPLASGATNWSGPGGPLAGGASRRPTLSASAGGGLGGGRAADGVTLRSRALTADEVVSGSAEPNRYGSVYRWRLRQLSARGVGAGTSSMDMPHSARGGSIKQRMGRRANRRKGADRNSASSFAGSTAASHDTAMLSAIPRAQHIYRFKHVRFNRMHVKLTYEGPPISLNEFRLVLDHRVYQGLEGTWKTLLNKYKWDVVRSVLKSMAGMQKGKVHELEFGANPLLSKARLKAGALRGAVPEALQDALTRGGGGLRHNLKALLGIGKSRSKGLGAAAAAAGDPSVSSGTASTALIMDEELLQAAEALRQRQARLALLLGTVPPPPTRKLLLEHESEL